MHSWNYWRFWASRSDPSYWSVDAGVFTSVHLGSVKFSSKLSTIVGKRSNWSAAHMSQCLPHASTQNNTKHSTNSVYTGIFKKQTNKKTQMDSKSVLTGHSYFSFFFCSILCFKVDVWQLDLFTSSELTILSSTSAVPNFYQAYYKSYFTSNIPNKCHWKNLLIYLLNVVSLFLSPLLF